MKSVQLSTRSE